MTVTVREGGRLEVKEMGIGHVVDVCVDLENEVKGSGCFG